MCDKWTGIIMYAHLRNCTSLYSFFFFFFMFSIFQIMDDNTITLTFARTKKYGDWGSAKADIALVSSIS